MAPRAPLPSTPKRGAYTVRVPRHTDDLADALGSAFPVEKMSCDWLSMLDKLDRQ